MVSKQKRIVWKRLVVLTEGPTDVDALSIALGLMLREEGYELHKENDALKVVCMNHARDASVGLVHIMGTTGRSFCFRKSNDSEVLTVVIGTPNPQLFEGYSGVLEALRLYMNSLYTFEVEHPTVVVGVIDGDTVLKGESNLRLYPGRVQLVVRKKNKNKEKDELTFRCNTVICKKIGQDRVPLLLELKPLFGRHSKSHAIVKTFLMVAGICETCNRAKSTKKYEIETFEATLVKKLDIGEKFVEKIEDRQVAKIVESKENEVANYLNAFQHEMEEWCDCNNKKLELKGEYGCIRLNYFSPLKLFSYILGFKDTYSMVNNFIEKEDITKDAVIDALKECNMYESLKYIVDTITTSADL